MHFCILNYILISSLSIYSTSSSENLLDNSYYTINWNGPLKITAEPSKIESLFMTTNQNEKYQCIIPSIETDNNSKNQDEFSPLKVELEYLKPMFDSSSCTYRLEIYWNYEMCNGRHIRQYHEEKEYGKKPVIQEYYLGKYTKEDYKRDLKNSIEKRDQKDSEAATNYYKRKTIKVQGVDLPYFEVLYEDGTVCDLTNLPRRSRVRYVCIVDGRGEVYEFKETSSCEYEIVVLSSQLCQHHHYGLKKDPIYAINCHNLNASPRRPTGLDLFDLQSSTGRYNNKENTIINNLLQVVEKFLKQTDNPDDKSIDQDEDNDENLSLTFQKDQLKVASPTDQDFQNPAFRFPPSSSQILKDFLNGDYCIEGGAGWWKHELCYGKHVIQYHMEGSKRIEIVLGRWNKEIHLQWLKDNPKHLPKDLNERKHVTHFYSGGSFCEETGKHRTTEVKLKCGESHGSSNAIALYLIESKTCQYQLYVEAPLLCDIVKSSDEIGLIHI